MFRHCRILDAAASVKNSPSEVMRATRSTHILVMSGVQAGGGHCERLLYSQH